VEEADRTRLSARREVCAIELQVWPREWTYFWDTLVSRAELCFPFLSFALLRKELLRLLFPIGPQERRLSLSQIQASLRRERGIGRL